jgi:hypothetical protein
MVNRKTADGSERQSNPRSHHTSALTPEHGREPTPPTQGSSQVHHLPFFLFPTSTSRPASQNFLRRAKTLAPSILPFPGLRRSQARFSGGRGSARRRRQGERRPRARDNGRLRGRYEAGGGAEDAAAAGEEAGLEEEGRGGGGQEDAYARD